jgi:hypothetical protein
VHKAIVAVIADHDRVAALREQGMSWSKVAERFSSNRTVSLTPAQADAWYKNGFAVWVERRRRMLITARLEAFARLRDLSAVAGDHVAAKRKEEWVGPFLRGQFLKLERRQKGGQDVRDFHDQGGDGRGSQA